MRHARNMSQQRLGTSFRTAHVTGTCSYLCLQNSYLHVLHKVTLSSMKDIEIERTYQAGGLVRHIPAWKLSRTSLAWVFTVWIIFKCSVPISQETLHFYHKSVPYREIIAVHCENHTVGVEPLLCNDREMGGYTRAVSGQQLDKHVPVAR
jgi:hypothetical protein